MKKVQYWTDKCATLISAVMIGLMMFILVFNIVMRLIPKIGGVAWYMESSQYLNVWAMVIIGIQITVMGTHLRVEVIDALVSKSPLGQKLVKIIDELFIILFYILSAYAGFLLATKAKQAVSTMPQFTMGQVYWMLPIAYGLSALAGVIDLIVYLQGGNPGQKDEKDRDSVSAKSAEADPAAVNPAAGEGKGGETA